MRYIQTSNNTLIHWGIKGMRWGVRRYRDENGKLTPEGEARYAREKLKNSQKPRDKRVNEQALKDPTKWVKDDMQTSKDIIDSSKRIVDTSQDIERLTRRNKKNPRLDLSNKTDKELRDEINRELLERQYNDVFNAPQTSRGRRAVETALKGAGAGLGLASAAVSVALGIHTLRYG